MASITKVITTKKIPCDADIFQRDGTQLVRIKKKGRAKTFDVLPCGTRYRVVSRKWYIQYRDENGEKKRVPGFSDKEATRQLASKIERTVERTKAGLQDQNDTGLQRPFTSHLEDFGKHLRAKEDTEKHVSQTVGRIRRLLEGCNIAFWRDLSGSKIENWLSEQRDAEKFGRKTSNYYLASVKEFCTWMLKDRRASSNPIAYLSPINADLDVRRKRKTIGDDEFVLLIQAAKSGKPIQCVPGSERAVLYTLAAWTGYRRGELASVTPSSFDFTSEPATVCVTASYSKRRRQDVIPLHPIVAEQVQQWLESRSDLESDEPVFHLRSKSGALRRTAKMMKLDLAAARKKWIESADDNKERKKREKSDFLTYQSAEGLFADFHSNRHTFISNLSKSSSSPKLAQTLARHSDINLTMGVYSHVNLAEQHQAIMALPVPPSLEQDTEAAESTTDEGRKKFAPQFAPVCDTDGQLEAFPDNDWEDEKPDAVEAKDAFDTKKSSERPCLTLLDVDSGGGTRTPDTRIMIPLL